MRTDLPPEHADYLHTAIASGKYRDETEVLSEALFLLKRRDEIEQSLEEASRELDAGLGIPAELVFQRLEDKISEIERKSESGGSCES